jgi:hypothetical protein
VNLFAVEFPSFAVSVRIARQSLKFGCVRIGIAGTGKLLEVIPHQLIHTRSERFGADPGAPDQLFING